jgi:hypothetical protein
MKAMMNVSKHNPMYDLDALSEAVADFDQKPDISEIQKLLVHLSVDGMRVLHDATLSSDQSAAIADVLWNSIVRIARIARIRIPPEVEVLDASLE